MHWKCPRCNKINGKELYKCSCGYIIGPHEQEKYRLNESELKKYKTNSERKTYNWKCPRCNSTNDRTSYKCSCGYIIGPEEQAKYKVESDTSDSKFESREEDNKRTEQEQRGKDRQDGEQYSNQPNIDKYYYILGLKLSASKEEVMQAYKNLIAVWNPSRFNEDPQLKETASAKIKEIDDAYEKLLMYLATESQQKHKEELHEKPKLKSTTYTDSLSSDSSSNSYRKAAITVYAGFWRRFVAALIDTIILTIGAVPIVFIWGIIRSVLGALVAEGIVEGMVAGVYIISIVLNWLYFTLLESSSKQATLGKMAIGIIVTDLNGSRISFGKANGRYWGKIVSGIILSIGFLMAGFTQKKQALHDFMAGTLVVKK